MNTKILMGASALFLVMLGILTSLFPYDVLQQHGTEPDGPTILLIQMMGAVYLGFGLLNWMARGITMSSIFAQPIALGNFLHFAIVALMLAWEAIDHQVAQLAGSAFVFGLFAAGFGWSLFGRMPDSTPED